MTWITMIKLLVLVYIGTGLFLYMGQRSLMYFPVAENHAESPSEIIDVGDATLKVWVVNPGQRDGLVYFGGNAEDVYYNAAHFRKHLPDRTVYLVNYRGYGGSSGAPSEAALTADALRLHADLGARHDRFGAIGRSLGSGVALSLAAQRDLDRLVLVTPFDSAAAVAQGLYPIYPVSLLLRDRYDNLVPAAQVTMPTLILIAEHDRIVPPRHAYALARAFDRVKPTVQTLPQAGHNGLTLNTDYWHALSSFFDPQS